MCGICGHTNDSRRTRVTGMSATMVPRGPDDERIFTDYFSGVSLGARRLSVIDVKGGRQPVTNENGTIWAALSGEIYNHPALRESLRHQGHRFASGVDTEVLVHLYEEYGASMVDLLEGMYAFAIWDARREELLVVRDRFGEKPLFYTEQQGELLFASELDALLAGMNDEPELDPASVDAFFVFGYVPGPASIFRRVKQLLPGHVLRWNGRSRRAHVDPYWSPAAAVASDSAKSFEELVAETGCLLDRSVRSRLIAHVPIGVLLDGGLDSTLVAALAARASDKPIKTFTVGRGNGAESEIGRARLTAEELGTEHHELVATQDRLLERVPGLLAGMDQPLADPAFVLLHAAAEYARREVTVAIGDEGADELFGGYSRYRWLWRSEPDCVKARRPALRGRLYGPALRGGIRETGSVGDLTARVNGASDDLAIRLMAVDRLHCLPDDALARADRAGMRVSLGGPHPLSEPGACGIRRHGVRANSRPRWRQGAASRTAPAGGSRGRCSLLADGRRGTGCRLATGPSGSARRPPTRAGEHFRRGLVRSRRGLPAPVRAPRRNPRRQRRDLAAARIRAVAGPQAKPGPELNVLSK
jgi:asparagine synthase (glutamine-hydrolysing)